MQTSLFDNPSQASTPIQIDMQDADVSFHAAWLEQAMSDILFSQLKENLAWRQDTITLYGKQHLVPRLQAWYGDPEAQYEYSGIPLVPLPWTDELLDLKKRCETVTGKRFNSVLANWYRHGQDSMGMHSDDEVQLGHQPVIASVSLGETRTLIFKHKRTKARQTIDLTHGSLLIMAGSTQDHWQHGINKTARDLGGRINLTFRWIYNESTTANYR
jgi:alkylated DNA repair dioxygenase AlkB